MAAEKKSMENQKTNPATKLEISYPCHWSYRVIGEDLSLLKEVIVKACAPHPVTISHSQSSSKGKYHSLNAALTVPDEATRLAIYERIRENPAVKIVL